MARLDGKVAIVTGGGNGIGRAICERFADEGARVVVADINLRAAAEVVAGIRARDGIALAAAVDVASRAQVSAMVQQTLEEYGQVDILVNNVGTYPARPFLDITEEEWDRIVDVNLKGTFLCSQTVARSMVGRGAGKIVNIASGTFYYAPPVRAHYVAAKAGVMGLTRAMARELGTYGINVNAVAPGLTITETSLDRPKEVFEENLKLRCIQSEEYPEDLVGAVLFFASADSDFVTGQTLLVDGGRSFT